MHIEGKCVEIDNIILHINLIANMTDKDFSTQLNRKEDKKRGLTNTLKG